MTCSICLDDVPAEKALRCDKEHLVCAVCLPGLVRFSVERSPLELSPPEQLAGRYFVRCPGGECSAFAPCRMAAVLAFGNEGEEAFEELLAAQQRLAEQRVLSQGARAAGGTVSSSKRGWLRTGSSVGASGASRGRSSGEEAERRKAEVQAVAQGLRSHNGQMRAYQCPRCGMGPIQHDRCGDLMAHHRRFRGTHYNNACPNCGWFSHHISHWPMWDGQHLGPSKRVYKVFRVVRRVHSAALYLPNRFARWVAD